MEDNIEKRRRRAVAASNNLHVFFRLFGSTRTRDTLNFAGETEQIHRTSAKRETESTISPLERVT